MSTDTAGGSTRRLGIAVAVALVLVLALRLFILCPYQVTSHSMTETILPGDSLLVDRLLYQFTEPRRGDVICFTAPGNIGQDFFGRVIGLGGETLEIKAGRVYIADGPSPVSEPYVVHPLLEDFGPVTLPPGYLFILGDNRRDARDSRIWGPIPQEAVQGKAVGVYFSDDPFLISGSVRWERVGEGIE